MTEATSDAVHVLLTATPDYLMGVAATLRSAAEAQVDDGPLVAHVCCLPTGRRADVELALRPFDVDVRWHEPSVVALPPNKVRMHPIAFQRIFDFDTVEVPGDRLIYLDTDILVRRSLRALWDTPMDHSVAAVRDPYIPFVSSSLGVIGWRELGFEANTPYLNAGVLLVDQAAWRDGDLTRKVTDYFVEHAATAQLFDQESLNAVLHGAWTALPLRYNTGQAVFFENFEGLATTPLDELDLARTDPSIVHFTATNPWHPACTQPFRDEWLAVARRTPWAGEVVKRTPIWRAAGGRLRKAATMLRYG